MMNTEKHYHIRWSNSNIDWKLFQTREEACDVAEVITKPKESYEIVERDAECERCRAFEEQASDTLAS